jgi:hypothetical protein
MPINSLISSLSIGFSDPSFGRKFIEIINTPLVPLEGDVVRLHWKYYIDDEDIVNRLEEFENNSIFLAHIISREFTNDQVITHITLFEELEYRHFYGKAKVK